MPVTLSDEIRATLPEGAFTPADILAGVGQQVAALTGDILRSEVYSADIMGIVSTHRVDWFLEERLPFTGPIVVDHAVGKPYPCYVMARCFGDTWSPPPLGPGGKPHFLLAPEATDPEALMVLINQVLNSFQARRGLGELLQSYAKQNGHSTNGPAHAPAPSEAAS